MPLLTTAVDAVATLPSFTYGLLIAPRVSFWRKDADAPSKRLHPSLQGRRGTWRPLPCTDLPPRRRSRRSRSRLFRATNNPGGSITNSAETIAAGVIQANELPTPLVWIEHWPEESTEGKETFELVVFSSYEVTERAPYLGETRAWIGDATWKPLDRTTVEVLVGEKV